MEERVNEAAGMEGKFISLSYTDANRLPPIIVRRPDKTELEFAIVAACMALPAGYWLVRTLFSLIAG